MKKNRSPGCSRPLRWSLGLVVLTMTGAMACGGDDSPGTTPAEEAGAVDTGGDTNVAKPDTGADTFVADSGADTSVPAEAGDTSTPDTPDTAISEPTGEFQILNVSDWHGQLDPLPETDATLGLTIDYGGLGTLSSYFKEDKKATANTLFVTSGDVTGATPTLSTLGATIPDEPAIKAMNFLGLQFDTLGNHNFDRGIDHYSSLIDMATYTVISSNLKNVEAEFNKGGKTRIKTPYVIHTVGTGADAIKVAFIGITNPDAPSLQFPGRMGTITIEEPSSKASTLAAAARKEGAHVVVTLVHMGATGRDAAGAPTGPLIEFAKGLSGVDLVLGDHTDDQVNTKIGSAVVTESRSKGRTYGKTLIKVTKGKVTTIDTKIIEPIWRSTLTRETLAGTTCSSAMPCPTATPAWTCSSTTAASGSCFRNHACTAATNPTTCAAGYTCVAPAGTSCVKTSITPDPAAETLIKPYRDALAAKGDIKVGKTTGVFERGPTCPPTKTCPPTATVYLEREFEQPLGNLVCDAMLDKYKPLGARVCFTNGGGLRTAIPSSYKPKLLGAVTATGTAPPTVTVTTASANMVDADVHIDVTTGGALGTMVFRYSLNGGTTWALENITSPATGKYTLGTTGIEVTFATGTYNADNLYTFKANGFKRTGCTVAEPCDVAQGDIFSVLPFGNITVVRPLTTELLWQVLESAVGRKPSNDGRFGQVAGFKFEFSASATVGARVKKIVMDDGTVIMDTTSTPPVVADAGKTCTADTECLKNFACIEDLDLKKKCMIRVVTNDFVNAGSEHPAFKSGSKLATQYEVMADDLLAYVKAKGTITPGLSNFAPPPVATARIIELP